MAPQLSNVLQPTARSKENIILIEYNLSSPWLSLMHEIVCQAKDMTIICVCLLHPPWTIFPQPLGRVKFLDWTGYVPEYESNEESWNIQGLLMSVSKLLEAIEGPRALLVDSPDLLCENLGSISKAYSVLKEWHVAILKHPAPSRLILPVSSRSSLLPLLITPSFASSLIHLILHPPAILGHLAAEYMILPPPHSPAAKFWPIFSGITARGETEQLVWGPEGFGWGDEIVIEVLSRSASGKRTVDRTLEGWKKSGPCELGELNELKNVLTRSTTKSTKPEAADPTRNLPFNLSLTESQQQSRAQVPLPYAHEGKTANVPSPSAIFYDPDSADDIDEDDPDEDLDI